MDVDLFSLVELWCASEVCKLDSVNYYNIFCKKKCTRIQAALYEKDII